MTERLIILMITGVVGGLIASIVDHGLHARAARWHRRIATGLLGFAVSVAAVEPFLIAMHLERFERRFEWMDAAMGDASTYYGARRQLAATTNLVHVVMGRRVENLEHELASVAKRQSVQIAGDEVTNTWRDIVDNAEHCICATNVVAKKEWSEVGDVGIAPQLRAMKEHHVAIVRVFLPDERLPLHVAQLREVAKQQGSARIPVYELPLSRITENPSYEKYLQQLGAVDVVVADDSIALLTQTHPITHEARGALLTSDPQTVRTAKEYVLRVLSDSHGLVPSRCQQSGTSAAGETP